MLNKAVPISPNSVVGLLALIFSAVGAEASLIWLFHPLTHSPVLWPLYGLPGLLLSFLFYRPFVEVPQEHRVEDQGRTLWHDWVRIDGTVYFVKPEQRAALVQRIPHTIDTNLSGFSLDLGRASVGLPESGYATLMLLFLNNCVYLLIGGMVALSMLFASASVLEVVGKLFGGELLLAVLHVPLLVAEWLLRIPFETSREYGVINLEGRVLRWEDHRVVIGTPGQHVFAEDGWLTIVEPNGLRTTLRGTEGRIRQLAALLEEVKLQGSPSDVPQALRTVVQRD